MTCDGILIPASASVPMGGCDTRARDSAGNLTTNQTGGLQFWMDANFGGNEPTLDQKKTWVDTMSSLMVIGGNDVAAKVKGNENYLEVSSPILKALGYTAKPQVDNAKTNPAAVSKVVTPASASVETTLPNPATPTSSADSNTFVSSISSAVSQYGMYIVVGVVIIIVAALVMAKAHIAGSAA